MRKFSLCLIAVTAAWVTPAMAQDASACKNARPTPIMATHTLPSFPPASVMTDEQGATVLELSIGSDGKVITDTVFQSSGSLRLDDAARDFVKDTWFWKPALTCRPITTRVQITWKLHDMALITPNVQIAWPLHESLDKDTDIVVLYPAAADWPADALQSHAEGDSFLMVAVAADGKATVVDHPRSSGSDALDAKAGELAQKHQWTPAMMDGKPVGTGIVVVVPWKLPPAP